MRKAIVVLMCLLATSAWGGDREKNSLAVAAERAVQQSKLTLPGSKPFYLKATIAETTNADSDYHASIEEHWLSPSKYRRTIESREFSQTLVVNGEAVYEKNTGDYFPFWLNELVTAMVDPLPMLSTLERVRMPLSKGAGGPSSRICGELHARVDRWVICFEGEDGVLDSVLTKEYAVEFTEYENFGGKRVARVISSDPEPGTHLEARITELTELTQPEENLFAVTERTPSSERIRSLRIAEEDFRKLVEGSTEIAWPTVGGGLTKGGCAVYVSADRGGHMREAWPEGCDNAGLQDPLRQAVMKWTLKPAISDGARVQVESLLGFNFHTSVEDSKAAK